MFSNVFLKSFRVLLLPFALLYWVIIAIRNWMYDRKLLTTVSFGLPVICIGNLSVGGTGKSPMVEYLLALLKDRFRVATLSRGYKRKTRGYTLAGPDTTALDIGDEPMQFHIKFPEVPVAVGEERIVAIPQLLHDRPATQVIILDDAFQHRPIQAGFNIILTDYSNLFTRDFYLPTGDLRDQKKSYRRADIILVTKCPASLSVDDSRKILKEIKPLQHQHVFFTAISYGEIYHFKTNQPQTINEEKEVLLVTGIANPRPLKKMLEEKSKSYSLLQYADHHIFTVDDLKEIRERFDNLEHNDKFILTTEKDAVRLVKFASEIAGLPLYIIPVKHTFLFNEGPKFDLIVADFITNFKNKVNNGTEKLQEEKNKDQIA